MSALLEAAQDARHDLGKYICMNQRWLEEDAPHAQGVEALQADLLRTQSGPAGDRSAFELWMELGPPLHGSGPEVSTVDAALGRLAAHRSAIEAGQVSAETLAACTADCKAIAAALKTLTRRLQKES